jgi:hypothetical protein
VVKHLKHTDDKIEAHPGPVWGAWMCCKLKEADYESLYIAMVALVSAIVLASIGVIVAGALCMTKYTCAYDGFSLLLLGIVQLVVLALFTLAFRIYDYCYPVGTAPTAIVTTSPV